MGVRKYRSVEEMPQQLWSPRLDPNNIRRACALMVWARRLCPPEATPGIKKHRSVAAASRARTGRDR